MTPKELKKLKPSALLSLALDDLKKCEKNSKEFAIYMGD